MKTVKRLLFGRKRVNAVFGEDNTENQKLNLQSVKAYFEQQNEELGHVVDKELQEYLKSSKPLLDLIKTLISGKI